MNDIECFNCKGYGFIPITICPPGHGVTSYGPPCMVCNGTGRKKARATKAEPNLDKQAATK